MMKLTVRDLLDQLEGMPDDAKVVVRMTGFLGDDENGFLQTVDVIEPLRDRASREEDEEYTCSRLGLEDDETFIVLVGHP